MKKILLFSSGKICRAIMAETLLKKEMDPSSPFTFYSSGTLYDELSIDNTLTMLTARKNDASNPNIKLHDEIIDEKFDLVFLLFNILTEKASLPQCKGSMYYIGYQGEMDDLEHTYKHIEHKVVHKIKSLLMREFDLPALKLA